MTITLGGLLLVALCIAVVVIILKVRTHEDRLNELDDKMTSKEP
jgi:hypothetical protein